MPSWSCSDRNVDGRFLFELSQTKMRVASERRGRRASATRCNDPVQNLRMVLVLHTIEKSLFGRPFALRTHNQQIASPSKPFPIPSALSIMMFSALFVLALAMTSAAACSSNSRHLRSAEEAPGRDLLVADLEDNGQPFCGNMMPSIDDRISLAKSADVHSVNRKLQAATNITIPVYVWHTYSPGSLPEEILTRQMIESKHIAALNYGFRATPFTFELKGVEIVESAIYGHCERLGESEYAMKRELRMPYKNVLNLYICDSAASDSRAWSSWPIDGDINSSYDGVVVRNFALVGSQAKKNNAIQNVVHETGMCPCAGYHWRLNTSAHL